MSIAPIVNGFPLLSRVARTALNWTQEHAANEADVPKISLARFEIFSGDLSSAQIGRLFCVYEAAGISFTSTADVLRIEIGQATAEIASASIAGERRSDYKGLQ